MTYQELKDRAKELGVEFTGQPAKAELETLIAEAEEAKMMAEKAAGYEAPNEESKAAVKAEISSASKKVNARQEAMKMSKVKITPLDERMRSIPSEYYSVGNKNIGFISKVVKFNQPTWEPACILQLLREKTMLIQESSTVNGKEVVRKVLTEAFAIVEVPLTAEEKAELEASKK
jgi:hypothetical protein